MRLARRGEPEHLEAVALIKWRDLMIASNPRLEPLRHLYHVANGGKRTKAEAGKFKAEGVLAGVSDYCLPVQMGASPAGYGCGSGACRGVYGACYIELKPPGKYLKPHQKDWLLSMRDIGNFAAWGVGWEECAALLSWYLLRDGPCPALRKI